MWIISIKLLFKKYQCNPNCNPSSFQGENWQDKNKIYRQIQRTQNDQNNLGGGKENKVGKLKLPDFKCYNATIIKKLHKEWKYQTISHMNVDTKKFYKNNISFLQDEYIDQWNRILETKPDLQCHFILTKVPKQPIREKSFEQMLLE